MKRLKLQVDDLMVESFSTIRKEVVRGTVYGAATQSCGYPDTCQTCENTCVGGECWPVPIGQTAGWTCFPTCAYSCGDSCGACPPPETYTCSCV